jgi:hypothetical protein
MGTACALWSTIGLGICQKSTRVERAKLRISMNTLLSRSGGVSRVEGDCVAPVLTSSLEVWQGDTRQRCRLIRIC